MSGTVQVLAGIYAVVLVVIGLLEITQYRNPRFYSIFVIEPGNYDAVRMWAVCVGAFNLTFATGIGLGLALFHQGYPGEGRGLVLFLVGAHLALGLVLVAVEHRLWRSAIGEAGIPALVLGLQFLT
jgi:putative membrane protein